MLDSESDFGARDVYSCGKMKREKQSKIISCSCLGQGASSNKGLNGRWWRGGPWPAGPRECMSPSCVVIIATLENLALKTG